jgi:3D (Asp-Asp-Asp) domain-containing protein
LQPPKVTILIFLLLTPAAFAKNDSLLARVTVYWASGGSGSDRDTRHHRCATGTRLRAGHCAVDPRHIPYGSRVLLPNGESLAAVDTGSAVRNRRAARLSGRTAFEKSALVIDRFFETKRQALAWASSHPAFMPIKVLRATTLPQKPMVAGRAPNQITRPVDSSPKLIASNDSTQTRSFKQVVAELNRR